MADIRFIVASGSAIGVFDLMCTGSCPKASESDFEEVSDGCIPERREPKVVARAREGSGAEILQLFVGLSMFGIFWYSSISNFGCCQSMGGDGRC